MKCSPSRSARSLGSRPAFTLVLARAGLAALVLIAAFLGRTAQAQPGAALMGASGDQALERAVGELDRARGAEVYAALRGVWETWNRADPARVEEALRVAAQSKDLPASARSYAGTLAAYARLRRGDTAAARKSLEQLGYVSRFLLIGPFDNEGKAGLSQDQGPELDFGQPLLTSKPYTGKERPVRWRVVPDAFPYGFVDLGALLRPETKVCGLLATFVSATGKPQPGRKISAWLGSGGGYRVFWNGAEVYSQESYARHDFDRSAIPLTLEGGPNLLVVKVCGDEQAPTFSLRLAEPDGSPARDLQTSNDLELAEGAAETARRVLAANEKKSSKAGKAVARREPTAKDKLAQGPLPVFERLTERATASAADLEAHARYLVATDGDDPAQHLARDLSRRAAEREPTVRRMLLASRLAEDRNQASEWLDKAEKLVAASGKPDVDVLLARAWHRRHGPNFRESLPLFQKVLELDPTHVEALRGALELHNLAGLPRTALAEAERAVERSPNSVGLLTLLAAQLRTLGRTTEAMEVESRYHGLRADDTGYLNQMLELALSRNDRSSALHFADRLLQAEPHDAWVLGAAARAYRRLGEPERALNTHRAALALAPEDVGTLRAMSDLQGELGNRAEQLALLRELVRVRPQDKQVREYIENMEPERPRADEAHAFGPEKFLYLRHAPAAGQSRRTLRDLTVSTVFQNGLSSQFRQVVFQPLTDAAAAQDRQYAFAYEASQQVVQLRGAKVYRKNGRVDEAIEWGEGPADDPSIAMYTSARTFYVQFPRLEAGDVVELRYRTDDVTPRNEFSDYFGEHVMMGGFEPIANAEYVLITPSSRKIYVDAQVPGIQQSTRTEGASTVRRFFAKELIPLRAEPSMPPPQEVLPFVHVSTYETWQDLGRWYWGLVRDQFDLDDETRRLARKIVEGKKTELEKVQAVYDWVIRNTRYVALEFGIYGYKPRRCVQTVTRGFGDCKDKATALVTLLKELGIKTTFVVLRTQMRGEYRSKLPSFAPFDHAIAYVPSLDLYLDGTAEHTGVTELPRMDLGAVGLLVNEGNSVLTHLPEADPEKNYVRRNVRAKLQPSGEARLELDNSTSGFLSAEWRRRYHAKATLRDRIGSDIGGEYPGFEIDKGPNGIVTSNLDDNNAKVNIVVRGTAATFARREGTELSMPVTTNLRMVPAFASLSARTQDVVLRGFYTTEDTVTVELGQNAEIVSLPQNAREDSQFGSYLVEASTDKDKVVVKSRVSVKVTRVSPKEYPAFRAFCERVDRALAPRLVVRP